MLTLFKMVVLCVHIIMISNGPKPPIKASDLEQSQEMYLAAASRIQRLHEVLGLVMADCVTNAIELGTTWKRVGEATQMSPQGAHKRFSSMAFSEEASAEHRSVLLGNLAGLGNAILDIWPELRNQTPITN
jgi:hypothetical protein